MKKQIRNNELLKDFGNHLRRLRKEKNLTQEKLAFKIGLEISQISRIERGLLNTSISTVFEIANALELDLKSLFDFKSSK